MDVLWTVLAMMELVVLGTVTFLLPFMLCLLIAKVVLDD